MRKRCGFGVEVWFLEGDVFILQGEVETGVSGYTNKYYNHSY